MSWWTTTLPKLFDVLMMNPTERMYAGLENSGEMPCTVGLVLLLGVAAFLYVWVQEEKRKQDKTLRTCMTALVLALLGIYASTSYFPWDKVQSIGLVSRAVTTLQLPLALPGHLHGFAVSGDGGGSLAAGREAGDSEASGIWASGA